MKRSLALFALTAVAIAATAQSARENTARVGRHTLVNFIERPGETEFSGRLIARPRQAADLVRAGKGAAEIRAMRLVTELELADDTIEHRASTDEYFLQVPAGDNEQRLARQLLSTGRYEYVEPDWLVFPSYTPNDPSLGSQWSHTNSQSRDAWDVQRGSANVIIAITDTGVHLTHEEFNFPSTNLVSGYNSVNMVPQSSGGQVQDINGHGTHCAGIAAGIGDNSRGIVGVNVNGTKIMPIRVSNSSGGGSSIGALTGAMLWGAQNGARVTSTSYSGYNSASVGTTGTTCKNTYNTLCHWAAGNNGSSISGADWADVVIVGATNSANNRASFSNFGTDVDLMAPGDNILSSYWTSNANNATYANLSGTSMASPFAAGLSGLLVAQNPSYSAQRIENTLYRSCVDMSGQTNHGWGRVNVSNAIGKKPSSFTLFRGNLVSGTVNDMYRVEGSVLQVAKGIVANALECPIQITSPHTVTITTASELNVQVTAGMNTAGSFAGLILVLNKNTGNYDQIGSSVLTTTASKVEATVTSNPNDYIPASGIVTVRFAVCKTGPVPNNNWQVSVDQTVVRTLR